MLRHHLNGAGAMSVPDRYSPLLGNSPLSLSYSALLGKFQPGLTARTSGENVFVVFLVIDPTSHELVSGNPEKV